MATQLLGEVISASSTFFTAQCAEKNGADGLIELPDPPAFGSFVRIDLLPVGGDNPLAAKTEDDDPFADTMPSQFGQGQAGISEVVALYGVVVFAESGAREPGRQLTAYGLDEAELRQSQPQIYELLASRFSVALIAHLCADGILRAHLPPRPPRPHARVWALETKEVIRLTERLDYLRPLLAGASATSTAVSFPADELVAALLRSAFRTAYDGDEAFLLRVGRTLAALMPLEYDRLRAIVDRIVS